MCMKKFATGKNQFWQNDCHLIFAIYVYPYVCLSVCIGFPSHIQQEADMHFKTLLFQYQEDSHYLGCVCVGGGGHGI